MAARGLVAGVRPASIVNGLLESGSSVRKLAARLTLKEQNFRMADIQKFEAKLWADAEITPGPVRLAMEEAERKKAERETKEKQGVEPKTEENKS